MGNWFESPRRNSNGKHPSSGGDIASSAVTNGGYLLYHLPTHCGEPGSDGW